MKTEKRTIHIPRPGFARPLGWEILSENNGLALCVNRESGKPEWQCVHLATGKPVFPYALRGGANRKTVAAFIAYAAPLFPWPEWQAVEVSPKWADDAFKAINDWRPVTTKQGK